MMGRGPHPPPVPARKPGTRRKSAGSALLVIGAAAIVAGASLVALPEQPPTAAVQLDPHRSGSPDPEAAGTVFDVGAYLIGVGIATLALGGAAYGSGARAQRAPHCPRE